MIYIDPPYNTGSEGWAYNDNVNSPLMKQWLGKVVDRDDLERHDKWLCMMWPRLQLLQELLSEDGIICCSIDENELHNLRQALDEIFGSENFLGILSRRTKAGGGSASHHFAIENDFVVIFAKDKFAVAPIFRDFSEEYLQRYSEEDREGKYFWDTMERSSTKTRPYLIDAPDGSKLKGRWFRAEARFKNDLKKGDVRITKKTGGGWSVQFKQRLPKGRKIRSLLNENEFKSSQDDLELLGLKDCFPYPKPVSLLELLVGISPSDAIVLDSFAGSGTTAHAVLNLNTKNGDNRSFILVQLQEELSPENPGRKRGFKEIIDITTERVRRVIAGVSKAEEGELKKGLGGSFTYCELGDALNLDRFFDGKGAPTYEQVARYVVYTATGQSVPDVPKEPHKDWFVAEAGGYRVHLIYKPDLAFMRGNDAALALPLTKEIVKGAKGKLALVYAAAKFMSQAELTKGGVTFCQLPYSVHRVLGEAPDAP